MAFDNVRFPVNISLGSAGGPTRPGNNGSLDVIIEEMVADKLLRGGNKIDSAMAKGYGLRRQGR